MNRFLKFLKDWMLPLAMVLGVVLYIIYINIPCLAPAGPALLSAVQGLQPLLIFTMLFLSFCQISPKDMRPRKWHLKLLLFQSVSFIVLALVEIIFPSGHWNVLIESAMLVLICPTATAASVITGKLDGDMPGIVTYLILINVVTAILVPVFVPLIHPAQGITFGVAFSLILAKVFPLLIFPCLLSWIVRFTMPKLHRKIIRYKNLPFYLWGPSLMLAILMTTRSIYHSSVPVIYQVGIAVVSLLCCAMQFLVGRHLGRPYGETVTAGQALGQKNTVFAIWMGYTFMTPVTSVAGGFYSIWHNVANSWQLYRHDHRTTAGKNSVPQNGAASR